jgi:hypothetical protein
LLIGAAWASLLIGRKPIRRWTTYKLKNHSLPITWASRISSCNGIAAPWSFFKVILAWGQWYRSLYPFLHLGVDPALSILPLETSELVDGCGCMAFLGIRLVSFMPVISVRTRKLFSHLIHIIDKMRN